MNKFRILTISGGGVKGIIPAQIIAHIEVTHGKPIGELFDLVIGTSIGGILALAIIKPLPLTGLQCVDLIESRCFEIFPPSGTAFFSPKYPTIGITRVMRDLFGSTNASEHRPTAYVTAFESNAQEPVLLGAADGASANLARATSAGPTYFSAQEDYIDGGVVANSPEAWAIALAVSWGHQLEDIHCLALGTGIYDPSQGYLADAGQVRWVTGMTQVMIDGVAKKDQMIAAFLLGPRYLRVDCGVVESAAAFDNTDPVNLAYLKQTGADLARLNKAFIESWLQAAGSQAAKPV